jgi:DNA-binding CsgD family transcriptional regulator
VLYYSPPVPQDLVGRARELSELDTSIDRLLAGGGSLVCIVGEAGIGKTSLVDRATRGLSTAGVTVRRRELDELDGRRHAALLRGWFPTMPTDCDLVDAAIAAIEQDAATGPLALVADDFHWADHASAQVVTTIAREAADLGVLVLVAMRPYPATRFHERLADHADRHGVVLRPSPLDEEQVAEFVRRRVGAGPDRLLKAALDATGGNPFLLDELLGNEAGPLEVLDGFATASNGPSAAAMGRLASRALRSVAGSETLLRVLACVPGGAAPDELAEVLDGTFAGTVDLVLRCIDAGVLVESRFGATFRHDLLRQAVVQATPLSLRRATTRRFADMLTRRRADPERIAACLLAAPDPNDPGDQERIHALAIDIWRSHPDAAVDLLWWLLEVKVSAGDTAAGVLDDLGWALVAAGRAGEVGALIEDHAGPFDIDEPPALQRLRGTAETLAGNIDRVVANYAGRDWREIAARYDPRDTTAVDAIAELAQLRASTGAIAEADEIADWVDAAPAPPTPLRALTVASARAIARAAAGRMEEGLEFAREAIAIQRAGGAELASDAATQLLEAMILDHLGDCDAALKVVRRVPSARAPRWTGPLLESFAAVALYRRGDWDDALAEVDAALRAAGEVDAGLGAFWPPSVGVMIAAARGDRADADRWLGAARTDGCRTGLGREWMALATCELLDIDGKVAESAQLARFAADRMVETGCVGLLLNGGPDLVRRCLAAGDPDGARRISVALVALTRSTRSQVAMALAAWSVALVDRAPCEAERAALILDGVPRVPEAARAFADAALIAASKGAHADARGFAKEAYRRFDLLGADLWAKRLRNELSAGGISVRTVRSPARPRTGWESLTASERMVVAYVGEGLTNSAIADRLVVSRRTVESHLVRVYTKLGFTGRTMLAAQAARRSVE